MSEILKTDLSDLPYTIMAQNLVSLRTFLAAAEPRYAYGFALCIALRLTFANRKDRTMSTTAPATWRKRSSADKNS